MVKQVELKILHLNFDSSSLCSLIYRIPPVSRCLRLLYTYSAELDLVNMRSVYYANRHST